MHPLSILKTSEKFGKYCSPTIGMTPFEKGVRNFCKVYKESTYARTSH